MKNGSILLALIFTGSAAFATNYKYNELAIKNYDEMNSEVQKRTKKARDVGATPDEENGDNRAAIEELRDALKLVLSRPNSDNMVAKLTLDIRRDLTASNAYADTISSIVSEAVDQIKNDKAGVNQRATALFIVENALSEIRPEVKDAELRSIVQRVKDAKIKVAKDVIKDLKMGSMYTTPDPSKQAAEILKAADKKASGDKK
jgi:hypothetical protein